MKPEEKCEFIRYVDLLNDRDPVAKAGHQFLEGIRPMHRLADRCLVAGEAVKDRFESFEGFQA